MTTENRTERRLMDSIRKAKSGPTPGSRSATRKTPAAGGNAAKPVQRDAAQGHARSGDTAQPAVRATADPYQSGRRIWPD